MENLKLQLHLFFTHPIFLACTFSWLSAQFIKTLIKLFSGKIKSVGELFELLLWRSGGMPSSHSALVVCLCTVIGFRLGISSDLFMLSLAFCLVTIRDALGVRRASGMQANLLNQVCEVLYEKDGVELKPVKVVQGHSPIEVLVGCILGLFIGIAFCVL